MFTGSSTWTGLVFARKLKQRVLVIPKGTGPTLFGTPIAGGIIFPRRSARFLRTRERQLSFVGALKGGSVERGQVHMLYGPDRPDPFVLPRPFVLSRIPMFPMTGSDGARINRGTLFTV